MDPLLRAPKLLWDVLLPAICPVRLLAALLVVMALAVATAGGEVAPSQRRPADRAAAIRESSDLSVLVAALRDADASTRYGAAVRLGDLKLAAAIEPLRAALQDKDASVREAAGEALEACRCGAIQKSTTLAFVVAALQDDRFGVRHCASSRLGALRRPGAVEPLVAALGDENWSVRQAAAEALGSIADPRAVPALCEHFADDLAGIQVRKALVATGAVVVPCLISQLRHPQEEMRAEAARTLEEVPDARAVGPLGEALADQGEFVASSAVRALATIGNDAAVVALAASVSDPRVRFGFDEVDALLVRLGARAVAPLLLQVRPGCPGLARAATLLGQIKDPRAVEPLIGLLDDPSPVVARAAARALASIGDPRAAAPLAAHLSTLSEAADALATSLDQGQEAALLALVAALQDPQPLVRRRAAEAFSRCRKHDDRRPVAPLVTLLRDPDDQVRREAAVALANLADRDAVGPLIERLAREPDPWIRGELPRHLLSFRDERVVGALVAALADLSHQVNRAALDALRTIDDSRAREAVARADAKTQGEAALGGAKWKRDLEKRTGGEKRDVCESCARDSDCLSGRCQNVRVGRVPAGRRCFPRDAVEMYCPR
jgi:HEAT repeat protein